MTQLWSIRQYSWLKSSRGNGHFPCKVHEPRYHNSIKRMKKHSYRACRCIMHQNLLSSAVWNLCLNTFQLTDILNTRVISLVQCEGVSSQLEISFINTVWSLSSRSSELCIVLFLKIWPSMCRNITIYIHFLKGNSFLRWIRPGHENRCKINLVMAAQNDAPRFRMISSWIPCYI